MAFFIGIACPWLLVAVFLMMMHRRAEDPTAGQWRSQPSAFFGGPASETSPADPASTAAPSPTASTPAAATTSARI